MSQSKPIVEDKEPTAAGKGKGKRGGSVAPKSIRGRIAAGVLLIIPLAVTLILIRYVYETFLSVGVWLVHYVLLAVFWIFKLDGSPKQIDPSNAEIEEKTVAVVLTILLLYLLGWLGTNVVGQRLISFFEGLLGRIPLVDTIYTAIKRMVGAMSGGPHKQGGQKVVLIDFPYEKMKAVGFVTNVIMDRASGQRYATVFVPTAPNPTSGYMELVPIERVTATDWTLNEALSMILSGGASAPPHVSLSPFVVRTPGEDQPDRLNKAR